MEPLTAGAIAAVCDCCPALQPLSAAAATTQIAVAALGREFNEFTILSDQLEVAGQTVVYPPDTSIFVRLGNRGIVREV
jgi:hypothetical protein